MARIIVELVAKPEKNHNMHKLRADFADAWEVTREYLSIVQSGSGWRDAC